MAERQAPATATARPADRRWYNDERVRGVGYQLMLLAFVGAVGWFLISNTLENLEARSIATGFGFLGREAGFGISEHSIAYSPADSYLRALVVGLVNTLEVSALGIILATIIGTIVGIARLSSNWLVGRIATAYVESTRNVPVLLQLFFWYALITEGLPSPRQAFQPLPGLFLSNRGLKIPVPEWTSGQIATLIAFLVAIVAAWLVVRWGRRKQERTGREIPAIRLGLGVLIGLPLLVFLLSGLPTAVSVPELRGFNFTGGGTLTPEFTALTVGLSIYTAGFIAEIVRGGILAVSYGQTEAAMALGLSRSQVLRFVLLPQSLRVIVPPLTSQYLNLAKNSTLAVAIGYPDLVSTANTAINQTGQAVEGVAIIMGVYLTLSLLISAFMNWYNGHIALRGGGR